MAGRGRPKRVLSENTQDNSLGKVLVCDCDMIIYMPNIFFPAIPVCKKYKKGEMVTKDCDRVVIISCFDTSKYHFEDSIC
jgi:hypothetical protein